MQSHETQDTPDNIYPLVRAAAPHARHRLAVVVVGRPRHPFQRLVREVVVVAGGTAIGQSGAVAAHSALGGGLRVHPLVPVQRPSVLGGRAVRRHRPALENTPLLLRYHQLNWRLKLN